MASPEQRAAAVLEGNRYMVLGTVDADGPWTAALAYTIGAEGELCFVSQRASRHGMAIATDARVAGVIFDSRADAVDVESIQFSGSGRIETDRDAVRRLLAKSAAEEGVDEAEVERLVTGAPAAMFAVTVSDAYVLDQEAWEKRGVDARQPVDLRQLLASRAQVEADA